MESRESYTGHKRSRLIWVSLITVIFALILAAFIGGQFLNRRVTPLGEPSELLLLPAEELPRTPPDAVGVSVRREDNRFWIGTGNLDFLAGSESEPSISYDGPVLEVIVNNQTEVYRDITTTASSTSDAGSGGLEQKVGAGTIEEIGENSQLTVWGRKVGDRIIADFLLYYQFDLAGIRQAIGEKESRKFPFP